MPSTSTYSSAVYSSAWRWRRSATDRNRPDARSSGSRPSTSAGTHRRARCPVPGRLRRSPPAPRPRTGRRRRGGRAARRRRRARRPAEGAGRASRSACSGAIQWIDVKADDGVEVRRLRLPAPRSPRPRSPRRGVAAGERRRDRARARRRSRRSRAGRARPSPSRFPARSRGRARPARGPRARRCRRRRRPGTRAARGRTARRPCRTSCAAARGLAAPTWLD